MLSIMLLSPSQMCCEVQQISVRTSWERDLRHICFGTVRGRVASSGTVIIVDFFGYPRLVVSLDTMAYFVIEVAPCHWIYSFLFILLLKSVSDTINIVDKLYCCRHRPSRTLQSPSISAYEFWRLPSSCAAILCPFRYLPNRHQRGPSQVVPLSSLEYGLIVAFQ